MPDSNRRVMLIDDDMGDTLLLKKLLLKHNNHLEIDVEQDPENALSKLEALAEHTPYKLPDVILLDINMPRMTGFELKEKLSQSPQLSKLPVIFLTTSAAPSDIDNAYKLGGNAYLTKPGDLGGMRQIVEAFVNFWLRSAQLPSH